MSKKFAKTYPENVNLMEPIIISLFQLVHELTFSYCMYFLCSTTIPIWKELVDAQKHPWQIYCIPHSSHRLHRSQPVKQVSMYKHYGSRPNMRILPSTADAIHFPIPDSTRKSAHRWCTTPDTETILISLVLACQLRAIIAQ